MTAFHLPQRLPAGLPKAFHLSHDTEATTPKVTTAPSLSVYPPHTDHRSLAELFALRYQVYCTERRFLQPLDHPDGLELDAEDTRSAHFAARSNSATLIGCSRLILGHSDKPFPTLQQCATYPDFEPPIAARSAEVSRLAVSRQSQRKGRVSICGTQASHQSHDDSNKQSCKPPVSGSSRQVVLELYRGMYRYSRENGIRYWYAAMEQSLWRLLARLGVLFTQIGPEQDYYGNVIPCLYDLEQLDRQLASANPALLDWFQSR